MAYQQTVFATGVALNNLAAPTGTTTYEKVLVAPESNGTRLVLTDTVTNTRWVADGRLQYASGDNTVNRVSGQIDSASAYVGDILQFTINFGRPFDVRQLFPASASQTVSQWAYWQSFLSGDDRFWATRLGTAADQVQGLDGNDQFAGYGGVDSFDGGNGRDTAVYRGRAFDYTITPLGNNRFRVRDNVGQRDDTDTVSNVERLQFSDYVIALDTAGVAGQAFRIYKAAFNRTPDLSGLGYWINRMDSGMDLIDVSARFIDSAEFRTLYGNNLTNDMFLTRLYGNVLQRSPESSGYQWWLNQLQTNPQKTWQKVLADFSESAENQANVAQLIATGISYDPPG